MKFEFEQFAKIPDYFFLLFWRILLNFATGQDGRNFSLTKRGRGIFFYGEQPSLMGFPMFQKLDHSSFLAIDTFNILGKELLTPPPPPSLSLFLILSHCFHRTYGFPVPFESGGNLITHRAFRSYNGHINYDKYSWIAKHQLSMEIALIAAIISRNRNFAIGRTICIHKYAICKTFYECIWRAKCEENKRLYFKIENAFIIELLF